VRLIFGNFWDIPWQFRSEKSPRDLLKKKQATASEQPHLPAVKMHGKIFSYDATSKSGEVLGPNGIHYFFRSSTAWRVGAEVNFDWSHMTNGSMFVRAAMNLTYVEDPSAWANFLADSKEFMSKTRPR
jgi:hypothetical protein